MATTRVAVKAARSFLAHVPGLVRYGSKPAREIGANQEVAGQIAASLRTYEEAASYPANLAYLGGIHPQELVDIEHPWFGRNGEPVRKQPYGEIMPEEEFIGIMKAMDAFDLLWLEEGFSRQAHQRLAEHPCWAPSELTALETGVPASQIEGRIGPGSGNLPIHLRDGTVVGVMNSAHDEDASLFADVLLENLACKAAAVMATKTLLVDTGVPSSSIPYILNSGEEAVGDRYQRGGGNLAKAVGEVSGCTNATGSDVKGFCCGPNHAMMLAAGLIASGLFERVLVVGGCSFSKLGMKFQGHLNNKMPILEDVLAGAAILMEKENGSSPILRMDSIGTHRVSAGSSQANILEELVGRPLKRLGLEFADIDKYATEMHNPEVTEPAGSGDVPALNYRMIAALAVRSGQLERSQMAEFATRHGMPGFSPTQGHIASAIPFLPHAIDGIQRGELRRVMLLAKGSLFLGRMTQMSDGLSFIIEGHD